jgi:hypothetical protein
VIEIITLASFSPQNREPKRLRHHNRQNKGLTDAAMQAHPTVTASTMIARFNFVRKVRCHNVPVDFFFIWNPRGMLPKPIKACNGLLVSADGHPADRINPQCAFTLKTNARNGLMG